MSPEEAFAYANRAITYTFLEEDTKASKDVARAVELGFDPGTHEGSDRAGVESAVAPSADFPSYVCPRGLLIDMPS